MIPDLRLALAPFLCEAPSRLDLRLHEAIKKKDPMAIFLVDSESIDRQDAAGFTPMHYAIEARDKEMVQFLLEKGASPNFLKDPRRICVFREDQKIPDFITDTPDNYLVHAARKENLEILNILLREEIGIVQLDEAFKLACKTGSFEIAKLFKDIDGLKQIEKLKNYSAVYQAYAEGHKEFLELFTPEDHAQFALKQLGHVLHMSNPVVLDSNKKVSIHGSPGIIMYNPLLLAIESLGGIHRDIPISIEEGKKMAKIADAINADNCHLPEDLEKIQRNELVFVRGGWTGHALQLVFYNGYMAICNTGQRRWQERLEIYKIDPKKCTQKILEEIRGKKDRDISVGLPFIYRNLPKLLSGEKDEFCQMMEKFPSDNQKVGNCSFTSKAAGARFAYLAQFVSKEYILKQANERFNEFLNFLVYVVWEKFKQVLDRLHPFVKNCFFRKLEAIKNPFLHTKEIVIWRNPKAVQPLKIGRVALQYGVLTGFPTR